MTSRDEGKGNPPAVRPSSGTAHGPNGKPLQSFPAFHVATFANIGPPPVPDTLPHLSFDPLAIYMEADPLKDQHKNKDKFSQLHLGRWPKWLAGEVKRQTAPYSITQECYMVICLQEGFQRMNAEIVTERWGNLSRAAISPDQLYPDPEDYDAVERLTVLDYPVPDPVGTGYKDRPLRMPLELQQRVSALAGKLGMTPSQLAQYLILDGLRSQPGTVRPELMDSIFDAFYNKLRKRLWVLSRNLQAFAEFGSFTLSPEVLAVLSEMGLLGSTVYEP